MKLFIGGEMGPWPEGQEKDIRSQQLAVQHTTVGPLEEFLKDKNYGPGLVNLGLIPMIFRPDIKLYKERRKYNSKKGEADYRLTIDYNTYVNTDEQGKRSLLIKNLIETIREIGPRAERNKVAFDSEQMEKDIRCFLNFDEEV